VRRRRSSCDAIWHREFMSGSKVARRNSVSRRGSHSEAPLEIRATPA